MKKVYRILSNIASYSLNKPKQFISLTVLFLMNFGTDAFSKTILGVMGVVFEFYRYYVGYNIKNFKFKLHLSNLKNRINSEINKLIEQLKSKYKIEKDTEVVFSLTNFYLAELK